MIYERSLAQDNFSGYNLRLWFNVLIKIITLYS